MRVFISWSGPRSLHVAEALRDWLADVLQYTRPWVSKKDIAAGAEWLAELRGSLKDPAFGIVVLTSDNLDSRWLNFEAGALTNALTEIRVCPFLVDLTPTEVAGPLAARQAIPPTHEGLERLVKSINAAAPQPLDAAVLVRAFERTWKELEAKLQTVPPPAKVSPVRSVPDMVAEILETVRSIRKSAAMPIYPADPLWTTPAEGDTVVSYVASGRSGSGLRDVSLKGTPWIYRLPEDALRVIGGHITDQEFTSGGPPKRTAPRSESQDEPRGKIVVDVDSPK